MTDPDDASLTGFTVAITAALGGDNPRVVEAAVGRLRSALGAKELIATVIKRGYRLAVDFIPDDAGMPH